MSGTSTAIGKCALIAAIATAALNATFFLLSIYAASISPVRVVEETKRAFASGELGDSDYLAGDWRRGWNQFNDCTVLQLAINSAPSTLDKALAPRLYVPDDSYSDVCRTLRRIVEDRAPPKLLEDGYSRYWHGYLPLTIAVLHVSDVYTARQGLRLLVVASLLALLAAAATASGTLRIAGISVGFTGLFFWGLPFHGQGFSHAPGDALVMAGLASLVWWRHWLLDASRLTLFAAGYGCLVTYMEFLTGQIPTAASLLFLFTFLACAQGAPAAAADSLRQAWVRAFGAVSTFAGASLGTVLIKQLIVVGVLGRDQLGHFVTNLGMYSGMSADGASLMTYVRAFLSLIVNTPELTYHSGAGAAVLVTTSALAWVAAATLAFRSHSSPRRQIYLAHVAGAAGVVAWVLILPTHAEIHGSFMVRILVAPLALGWSALAAQLSLAGTPILRSRQADQPGGP